MKYEFHVGDFVETTDGRIGYIRKVCQCDECKARGFYDAFVLYTNGDTDCIIVCDYKNGFSRYRRIGQYDFTKKKEEKIELLNEEYTKSFPFYKLERDRLDMRLIDFGVMCQKINELVEAVNELKEQSNKN